MKFLGLAF
jgi:hypothetical protein